MIDRLPPSALTLPAQASTIRAPMATPFADWLAPQRPMPELAGDRDGDLAHTAMGTQGVAPGVCAEACADAQPVDMVFEFHLSGDRGAVEVVSVPWRLAGNAGLSYLSSDPHALRTGTPLHFDGGVGGMATRTTTNAAARLPSAAFVSREPSLPTTHGASVPLVPAPRTSVDTPSRIAAEMAGTALPASVSEPWLARLLRWFEQQGREAVVWIRDYHLDDAASHAVAEEIRTLANQQGWQLDRIVVNSREMWRAPSNHSHEETPSCL